jgi:hypothetical protein
MDLCAKKLQPIKKKRMNRRYGEDWRGRRFHSNGGNNQ